jgi:hypothetical protein
MTNLYNQIDQYRSYRFTVPANGEYKIHKYAKYISLYKNTGETENDYLIMQLQGQAGGELPAGISLKLEGEFGFIRFVNETANDMTCFLGLSNGEIFDTRFTATGAIDFTVPVNLVPKADVSCPPLVATKVLDENAARNGFILTNLAAIGTSSIRVANSAVAANMGTPIDPKVTWERTGTGEIWVYNPHSVSIGVAVSEAV